MKYKLITDTIPAFDNTLWIVRKNSLEYIFSTTKPSSEITEEKYQYYCKYNDKSKYKYHGFSNITSGINYADEHSVDPKRYPFLYSNGVQYILTNDGIILFKTGSNYYIFDLFDIEKNALEELPNNDSFINENSIQLLNDTYGKIITESAEITTSKRIEENNSSYNSVNLTNNQYKYIAKITKIEGQTRTSINKLNIQNTTDASANVKVLNGVISINNVNGVLNTPPLWRNSISPLKGKYTWIRNSRYDTKEKINDIILRSSNGGRVLLDGDVAYSEEDIVENNPYVDYWYNAGDTINIQKYFARPMLLEGDWRDNIPDFEPYNPKLMNSKATIKSIRKNLLNLIEKTETINGLTITIKNGIITINGIATGDGNIIIGNQPIELNGPVSFFNNIISGDTDKNPSIWFMYENSICGSVAFNTKITNDGVVTKYIYGKIKELRFGFSNGEQINNLTFKPIAVVGDVSEINFEQYQDNIINIDIELGEYDYIDFETNEIVKRTSEILTLDGSDDEIWEGPNNVGDNDKNIVNYVYPWQKNNVVSKDSNDATKTVCTLMSENQLIANATIAPSSYSNSTQFFIRVNSNEIQNIEQFKERLKNNPVQLAYQISPTTIPINIQNSYEVWNNGIQLQLVDEGYLPYKITKKIITIDNNKIGFYSRYRNYIPVYKSIGENNTQIEYHRIKQFAIDTSIGTSVYYQSYLDELDDTDTDHGSVFYKTDNFDENEPMFRKYPKDYYIIYTDADVSKLDVSIYKIIEGGDKNGSEYPGTETCIIKNTNNNSIIIKLLLNNNTSESDRAVIKRIGFRFNIKSTSDNISYIKII